jgi:antitoxin component YwqK of YwqJK toxin-antitoxin module
MNRLLLYISLLLFSACKSSEKDPVSVTNTNDSLIQNQQSGPDTIFNGIYRTFHANGSLKMEGNMLEGKRNGNWRAFFPDGTLWSEGFYDKGLRNGGSWVYHPNGKIKIKGSYEQGKKAGIWYFYNEQGSIIDSSNFNTANIEKYNK